MIAEIFFELHLLAASQLGNVYMILDQVSFWCDNLDFMVRLDVCYFIYAALCLLKSRPGMSQLGLTAAYKIELFVLECHLAINLLHKLC